MEQKLFGWQNSDCENEFYGCVLRENIGDLKIGQKVDTIYINCESGEMIVFETAESYIAEEPTHRFELELTVKK